MAAESPKMFVTRASSGMRLWWLLRSASIAAYENGCFGIAKGAAYSALLSFFPVLTTLATVLVQARAAAVSRTIAGLLFEVVPPGTEDLVRSHFVASGRRPAGLLVVAVLLSAWAASGAILSLMEGFNAAYHIPTGRPFLKQRGVAILLVFCAAIPVVGASALILFGSRTEHAAVRWLGLVPEGAELRGWVVLGGYVVRYSLAFGATVLVTALLYYFGPNRKQEFRKLWPGAAVATVLWLLATMAIAWYVRNIANYNVLYGSVGAVIALLVWMYVLAVVALIGCEWNVAVDKLGRRRT